MSEVVLSETTAVVCLGRLSWKEVLWVDRFDEVITPGARGSGLLGTCGDSMSKLELFVEKLFRSLKCLEGDPWLRVEA